MRPSPFILEARSVSKTFGSVTALADINLAVTTGEWVAITGTSGSGKTTLLQLFATLETPTRGQMLYQGEDLAHLRNLNQFRRTAIGIVFQLHNLLPHLDVRSNVEIVMYGTHRRGRQKGDAVDRLLAELDLLEQQDRKPPELSGGERQRVAIARALANDPSVLLADEPTGSLDSDHVGQLLGLLTALNQERNLTIVMVTHDDEVAQRATRVIQLETGRITRGERIAIV